MPRDLFQGAPESSSTLARRAGLVPISIGAHVIVIAAAVLVPALAIGALPDPRASLAYVAHDILLPAIPVAPTIPSGPTAPPTGPPIDAPSTLPPLDYEPPVSSDPPGAPVEGGLTIGGGEGITGGMTGTTVELPPPPPPPERVVRVGGEVRPPVKIKDVSPLYPDIARSARVQGIVILEAVIDASGRIASTRLLRSVPLLDEAAITAVRQWVFAPTRLNGAPTSVIMTITVQFRLN